MDLNQLHNSLDNGILFLGKLLETLQRNSTPQNVHSSVASTVAITKTLTSTAQALRTLMASSDQMFSRSEFRDIMGRLGEAIADAATNTVSRLELTERQRTEARDYFTDEVERLFNIQLEQYQREITDRRSRGISALENHEDQRQ